MKVKHHSDAGTGTYSQEVSSLTKSQQPLSICSFRGQRWCGWNSGGKAMLGEEADPCSDATRSPFLYVSKAGSLYCFQFWIWLSSDFCCCRSGPCFLLLNAIKLNVLRLCKHFKLLHMWFWMLDRFILNINGFYEIPMWKCFFAWLWANLKPRVWINQS